MNKQEAQEHLQRRLEAEKTKLKIRAQLMGLDETLNQIGETLNAFEDRTDTDPEAIDVLAAFDDDLKRWASALEFWTRP